jgi:hypothetical protein
LEIKGGGGSLGFYLRFVRKSKGLPFSPLIVFYLSNGHSPQIRENGKLLGRMWRGESHFSQKWRLANVGESREYSVNGLANVGEFGESAQHGLANVGESGESAQHGSAQAGMIR